MRARNCAWAVLFPLVLLAACRTAHAPDSAVRPSRAAWMQQARWGIMTHYLADWRARADNEPMSIEHWNELVDNFDVDGLASQIQSTGAGYHLISIGQNSGYYLAPNATYDKLVGNNPSKCSRRDLISDLAAALHKRGIRLMVYLPSGAPGGDAKAVKALEHQRGPNRNREFQVKWEAVIRDWSTRWGTNVCGWWFDGCYWPNAMYRDPAPPNFTSFAAAARAGNPDSIVAFNPGVVDRALSISPDEDYTAGEINDLDRAMIRRANNGIIDGCQVHFLSFLGQRWGMGEPRFSTEQAIAHTHQVVDMQGVITWDTPVQKNGLISQPFLDQLRAIGKSVAAAAPQQKASNSE